jgi:antirestriction protein ArdC
MGHNHNVGRDRAEKALAQVISMFESGELPQAIARTTIARAAWDVPSARWSLGNRILMYLANTQDARGYRQWQEVGRHVKQGAKAFTILAPKMKVVRYEVDEATGETVPVRSVVGFLGIPVFRYEDTEGTEIEQPDYRPAELPPLFHVAERLGVQVQWTSFDNRYYGRYIPSSEEINLSSHDVSVFFHELAHVAHRRVLELRGGKLRTGQHDDQEIVAETAAAALCHMYGYDGYLWHGAEYVSYYADDNPGRAAMRVISDVESVLNLILSVAEDASQEIELVTA